MSDADYQPVRDALPETLPPITKPEAVRAIKRIYRKFGKDRNNRRIPPWVRRNEIWVRRCWLSKTPTKGHWKGWGRLIHDVSHDIFGRIYPHKRPHDPLHAWYEAEIARYVASTNWLQGGLKFKSDDRSK